MSVKAVVEKSPKSPRKPPQPKKESLRAPSAYNLYYKAIFSEARQELATEQEPKPALPAVAKVIRAKWEQLDAGIKAPFEAEAAKLKAVVDTKRAEKKAEKKANAKPLSAYMLYTQDARPKLMSEQPGLKVTEAAKQLGQLWKSLSAADQQTYRDRAAKLLEEYKAKQSKGDQPSA